MPGRRYQKYQKEKDRLRLSYEREILRTQLEVQEQTFRKISQELHDNIGQMLSLTRLNLSTIDINEPGVLRQKIDDSKQLVGQAIQALRQLSHGLSTDCVSEMGLVKAIEYELSIIERSGSYETALITEGTVFILDREVELILFRIVQETLNNILKHSGSRKIIIHLYYRAESLQVSVRDDGKGFDLTPLSDNSNSTYQCQQSGLGIKNMQNRARIIGASFMISSTIGEGTRVLITVPFSSPTTY